MPKVASALRLFFDSDTGVNHRSPPADKIHRSFFSDYERLGRYTTRQNKYSFSPPTGFIGVLHCFVIRSSKSAKCVQSLSLLASMQALDPSNKQEIARASLTLVGPGAAALPPLLRVGSNNCKPTQILSAAVFS